MITFKQYIELFKENNTSGAGGVFGDGESFNHGGGVGNEDFYARGTAVIPYVIGTVKRKSKNKKNKRVNRSNDK